MKNPSEISIHAETKDRLVKFVNKIKAFVGQEDREEACRLVDAIQTNSHSRGTASRNSYEDDDNEHHPNVDVDLGDDDSHHASDSTRREHHGAFSEEETVTTCHIRQSVSGSFSPLESAEGSLGFGSDITFVRLMKKLKTGDKNLRTTFNYNLDDEDLEDRQSDIWNTSALPSRALADLLIATYFETVGHTYPFLSESVFRKAYANFWEVPGYMPTGVWVATLNMMFAIGAFYQFEKEAPTLDGVQHAIFLAKSRILASDMFSLGTEETLQYDLLACFYLLLTNRISRCWNILGLARRIAQGLGFHIEPSPVSYTAFQIQMRKRIWYSLYVLERHITCMLGRGRTLRDTDYSCSLPATYALEQSSPILGGNSANHATLETSNSRPNSLIPSMLPGSPGQFEGVGSEAHSMDCFIEMIKFSRIVGRVQHGIYRHPARSMSWVDACDIITELDTELLTWRDGLPPILQFDRTHPSATDNAYRRQRNLLAAQFHNLRSMIHRPCITFDILQLGHATPQIEIEESLRQCITSSIKTCMREAQTLIRILQSAESFDKLIFEFPRWHLVNYIMSAGSILAVVSGLRGLSEVTKKSLQDSIDSCMKLLEVLGTKSTSAKRCLTTLHCLQTSMNREAEVLMSDRNGHQQDSEDQTVPSSDIQDRFPNQYPQAMPQLATSVPELHASSSSSLTQYASGINMQNTGAGNEIGSIWLATQNPVYWSENVTQAADSLGHLLPRGYRYGLGEQQIPPPLLFPG